jgi:cyclin-dependent kinase-like
MLTLVCFLSGNLTARQREIFHKNNLFFGMRLPEVREVEPLEKRFPKTNTLPLDLMKVGTAGEFLVILAN